MIIALPVAGLILGLGSYLLYFSYAKMWVTRSVREAAICLVTPVSSESCRRRLESTLKAGLPFGGCEIIEFRLGRSVSKVEVSFALDSRIVRPVKLAGRGPIKEIRVSNSVPRTAKFESSGLGSWL